MDHIPISVANGIGVVAVVLIVGWLIWSGRLVPKSTHDSHVALLDRQLEDERHEKGEWRAESRIKDQQIHELTEQNTAMLRAFGPTLTDFLRGLRQAANRGAVVPIDAADEGEVDPL